MDALMSLGGADFKIESGNAKIVSKDSSGTLTAEVPLHVALNDPYDWDGESTFGMVSKELESRGLAAPFRMTSDWIEKAIVKLRPRADGSEQYDVQSVHWGHPTNGAQ